MLAAVTAVLVALALPPPAPAAADAPQRRIMSDYEIDRAVRRLDLAREARVYMVRHGQAEGAEPGSDSFAAEITVEDRAREFFQELPSDHTLPAFRYGGRQGPSYDPITGIPWWM